MELLDSFFFYGLGFVFIVIGAVSAIRDRIRGKSHRDHDVNQSDFKVSQATLSLFTSTLSASVLIRNPASVYFHGPQHWILIFSLPVAILFANLVTVPLFLRRMDKTALAYLDSRFGRTVLVVSLLFQVLETLIMMSFWISVPVRTLTKVTKGSSPWVAALVAVVVTIYSALGGMRAIQRVDLIQLLLIAAVNIALVSKGTATLGGFDEVFSMNASGGRSYFLVDLNPLTEEETSVVIFVSNFMFMLIRYSVSQSVINRYSPATDVASARLILWGQIPLMGLAYLTSFALGLVIYGYYLGCDPLITKRINQKDDVVGLYFEDLMGHRAGLVGLFSGSLLSSTLSATSSNLNGLASIMQEHVLSLESVERMRKRLRIGKTIVRLSIPVAALLLAIALIHSDAWFAGYLTNSTTAMNLFMAPIMGIFLMGFFNKRATRVGALVGVAAGFLLGFTLFIIEIYLHSRKAPAGASVTYCHEYYCSVSNASHCSSPTATSGSSSLAFEERTSGGSRRLKYELGGLISMLVTFALGSLASLLQTQSSEEEKASAELLAFVKGKEE